MISKEWIKETNSVDEEERLVTRRGLRCFVVEEDEWLEEKVPRCKSK